MRDVRDLGPYGQPTPTPSGGTSLSTPVQSPSATGQTSTGGGAPPAFVALVRARLEQMIGPRYYLVDQTQLDSLAQQLWQNVGMQQTWNAYQQAPATFAAALQTQIQATVLNTSNDPSIDPTILFNYLDLKQGAGESLTAAELTALSNSTQALNAVVPKPFNVSTVSGYDWMQPLPADLAASTGWKNHLGVDYGTPAGSRIVSPFAGTVEVRQDQWRGNSVVVKLDNGYSISFGHVASAAAQNGARVNPGDLVAISGQNVGISQGAVTLVEVWDQQGRPVNPHDLLDPIFKGTTFSMFPNLAGAQGTGMPTVNTVLDREYPGIKSDWQQYFGSPPSPEDVYNVLSHGSSPEQWRDYIRSLPSHIPNMTTGQAFDLRSVADSVSMKSLGHLATDGIVKDLYAQGFTSESAVKLWYDEHSPADLDQYKEIYKAAQPTMAGVFNEQGFDPRIGESLRQQGKAIGGPQA